MSQVLRLRTDTRLFRRPGTPFAVTLLLALASPGGPLLAQEQPDATQEAFLEELFGTEGESGDEDLFREDELSPDDPLAEVEDDTSVDPGEPTDPAPASTDEASAPLPEDDLEPLAGGQPRDAGIEEILITARGNPQSLLEAPMSVSAFNAEYLEALGASDIRDIAQFTPNLEIKSSNAASNPKIFIRGVGLDDARANASSSVAVLVDDVYMNSPAGQLSQMFDLGSVEVLRGPQGVFYGRNATAGAIRLLSNKPSGEFGSNLRFSYGEFDNGKRSHEVEGYFEAPLVRDILSTRISGKFSKRDGYLFNRCGTKAGQSNRFNSVTKCSRDYSTFAQEPDKWLNDVDNWAGRALLRLQPPNLDTDWTLNFHGGKSQSLATQFQVVGTGGSEPVLENSRGYVDPDNCNAFTTTPGGRVLGCDNAFNKPERGDPYKGDYFRTSDERLDLLGTSLTGSTQLGNWTLDSITGYEWHDRHTFINTDGNPFEALESRFTDEAWQITEELSARYEGEVFFFTVGGYVLYEELDVFNIFYSGSRVTERGSHPLQDQHQETLYLALYTNGVWDISDDFSIEAGLRGHYENKSFDITTTLWQSATGTRLGPDQGVTPFSKDANSILWEPTGELTLRYQPTEEINFYAKYTRGFKGAHFNGAAIRDSKGILDPANPEVVDSMELGWKTRWLDGLVAWNGATFYYNYQNQQVFQARIANFDPGSASQSATFVNELINANDTRIAGVESDLTFEYEGFRNFITFSYLFTEYTDFVTFEDRFLINPEPGPQPPLTLVEINNFSGNRVVAAPEFNVAGFVEYDLDLERFGTLTPRLDYNWRSEIFFTPDNDSRLADDPRWVLNSRLGWRSADDRLEVALWVRNLTDEAYRIEALDFTPPQSLQQINYVFSVPRTFGITLGVRF